MTTFEADLSWISDRYQALFGMQSPRYDHLLETLITPVLAAIATGDAPYHTLDHTLQVMALGHHILAGKQHFEGTVTPQDWLHIMVALGCHDVGYVKGIFAQDNGATHHYFDGLNRQVKIPATATGAALTDYHVDRSKAYVIRYLAHPQLHLQTIADYIELTRFPIPNGAAYQAHGSNGGLCRAADLLGQLSDRGYLQKLPALFQEFAEIGLNQTLGYATPADLKTGYPYFFWQVVYPYVRGSVRYLSATAPGRQAIAALYTNLYLAELNQPLGDATSEALRHRASDPAALLSWQEAGFIFTADCRANGQE